MTRRVWWTVLVIASGLVGCLLGCGPEVGACSNPTAAETVAYDRLSGQPAFAGQALTVSRCANGFCHASNIPNPQDRNGVPEGLQFDVSLAARDGTVDEDAIARLRRGRFRVVQEAHEILRVLSYGSMPPPGWSRGDLEDAVNADGGDPTLAVSVYQTGVDGEFVDLPEPSSPEGMEIVRNWLACGAPVIERPVARDDGVFSVNFEGIAPPVTADWPSIFGLLRRECADSRCHGGADAGFQITDEAGTYAALVNMPARGDGSADHCGDEGTTLIVPGDAGASLFLYKLEVRSDDEVCGAPMPSAGIRLRDSDLETIEAWITDGAPMSPPTDG